MKATWRIKAVKAAVRQERFLALAFLENWPFGVAFVMESVFLSAATERHVHIRLGGAVILTAVTWVVWSRMDAKRYRWKHELAKLARARRHQERQRA